MHSPGIFFEFTSKIQLINKYVAKASSPITSKSELKSYIEALFKDDDTFFFEIDLIIKYVWGDSNSKLSYIEDQGDMFYEDLSAVFTNNINEVAKETSDRFRVIFGVIIEYYFDTDKNCNTKYITIVHTAHFI